MSTPGAGPQDDWSQLFESLPVGAYRSTPDGRILRANPALARIAGYASAADLLAAAHDIARDWYVEPGRRAEFQGLLARDGAVAGFVSEVRRHGTHGRVWVSESACLVRAPDGTPLHCEGTVEDITAAVEARQALERREAQLQLLGRQLPGMVYRVLVRPDGSQAFEYVSEGVQRVYGVPVAEVMRDGSVLSRMRHPEDSPAIDAALRAAHADSTAHAAEFRIVHRDGSVRWVHAQSASVAHGADGDLRTGIILDITTHRQAEQMRAERDQAEARRAATTALMSRISHELRTPLNAVLGFAQLLERDGGLDARQQSWAAQIVDSGRHLLSLVEDVLDLSATDSPGFVLRPAVVDVADAVQASWAMLAAEAATRDIVLQPLPAALPRVRADPLRLRQVLGNLLSNAVKYNRPGGEVRVDARREGDQVAIEVADTGSGFTDAQRERLFQPFERLGAESGPTPGTGLGLALSQQLVRAMGGSIEVDSCPGRGCRFTVRLPAAEG